MKQEEKRKDDSSNFPSVLDYPPDIKNKFIKHCGQTHPLRIIKIAKFSKFCSPTFRIAKFSKLTQLHYWRSSKTVSGEWWRSVSEIHIRKVWGVFSLGTLRSQSYPCWHPKFQICHQIFVNLFHLLHANQNTYTVKSQKYCEIYYNMNSKITWGKMQ